MLFIVANGKVLASALPARLTSSLNKQTAVDSSRRLPWTRSAACWNAKSSRSYLLQSSPAQTFAKGLHFHQRATTIARFIQASNYNTAVCTFTMADDRSSDIQVKEEPCESTGEGPTIEKASNMDDKPESSSQVNDNKRQQRHGGSNNNKGQRKKSKPDKKNYTRKQGGEDGNADGRGKSRQTVHPGSYASASMRDLFHVSLPPHLLPPENPPTGQDYDEEKEKRAFTKKKVAFLLGYLGTGYSGFQTNEGRKTLQAEFELALVRSELISPLNFGYCHKYSWSTSGRTDKGVHACAQVASAKIQLKPDQTLDDVRELINSHLPDTFRVLDVVRTARSFCAKTSRSKVRYQYMIPAFCFWDRQQLRDLMFEVAPLNKGRRCPGTPLTEEECKQIKQRIKDYRISNDKLQSLQDRLQQYTGTHLFHNFTKGMTSKDPSAARYILSFKVEEPMIFESGVQWIPTQVVGQSFLLHQIRKMVSVALDSVRMDLPNLIPTFFDKENSLVSDLAPAQGLFLEMSFYDSYNNKIKSQPDLNPLDWSDENSPTFQRWKTFRNEVLMAQVVQEEDREGNFLQYLYNHEAYFTFDSKYGLSNRGEEKVAPVDS